MSGCGGGDREPLDRLQAPQVDLTGRWVTTAIDCSSFSSGLPQAALAELDGRLEYETLQSPGVRIVQMGNALAFTGLDTGRRWDGTISDDQFRFVDSDRGDVGGPESDPVELNVFLAHDAHNDPCEAYPTERYAFDLPPLKKTKASSFSVSTDRCLPGDSPVSAMPSMLHIPYE